MARWAVGVALAAAIGAVVVGWWPVDVDGIGCGRPWWRPLDSIDARLDAAEAHREALGGEATQVASVLVSVLVDARADCAEALATRRTISVGLAGLAVGAGLAGRFVTPP